MSVKTINGRRQLRIDLVMNVLSTVAVISLIAFMSPITVSQDSSASISGTVYGPFGESIPDAPIQVTNMATYDYQSVRSDSNG